MDHAILGMQGGWNPSGAWNGEGRHPPAAALPLPSPLQLSASQPAGSTLTHEQRERVERNRLAALQRQEDRWSASQAASQVLQSAPSSHAVPAAGVLEADSASSRQPFPLRGVLLRPPSAAGSYASQQPMQHQLQVQPSGPWNEHQHAHYPQHQHQQQPPPQRWPLPVGSQRQGSALQQPAPTYHGTSVMHQQRQAQLDGRAAYADVCGGAPSIRPGSAASLYAMTSQRQQQQQPQQQQSHRGFAFTPPPGLVAPDRRAAAGPAAALPVQEQQLVREVRTAYAAREHTRAATTQEPLASASAYQPHLATALEQEGLTSQNRRGPAQSIPATAPDLPGQSVAWSWPDQQAADPAVALSGIDSIAGAPSTQRARSDSTAGGSRGRARFRSGTAGSKAANITYVFDPTPQRQKPTTQVTLQQAISRHAKAKAEQQQAQQVQRPKGVEAAGEGQPHSALADQAPLAAQRQPVDAGRAGLPTAAASNRTQPQYGLRGPFANQRPPLAQHPAASGVEVPAALDQASLPPQPRSTTPAHSAQPGRHAIVPVPSLSSVSMLGRPPMPSARPVYRDTPTAGTWWPSPAPMPASASAQRSRACTQQEARRAKLQQLLCAIADPFAHAASAGRRWEWLKDPRDAQGRPPAHADHDPTTLHIPPAAWQHDLKGADAQYWRIKSQGLAHTVLFFQEGNFYHLKDRDADIGMRVGLQPMGGARGSAANMWCVGCNISAFSQWAAKVLSLGYTVARVDEDRHGQRGLGSTLVKRTLRCVYSPGTVLEGAMLDACGSQPQVTLFEGQSLRYGAAIVDVQTATVTFASWQEADTQRSMLRALLLTVDPAEVGFARGQLSPDTKRLLRQLDPVGGGGWRTVALCHIPHLLPADPDSDDPGAAHVLLEHTADMFLAQRGKLAAFAAVRQHVTPHAAAALQLAIQHLMFTQIAQAVLPAVTLRPLDGPVGSAHTSGHMLLDACALCSLELLSNSEGRPKGSLLHYLDRAATPAGRRKVRQFVANPLFRLGDIEERLATTELFMAHPQAAHSFQAGLHRAPDCERLLAKAATVLAGVVDEVAAAEEAEDEAAQALPQPLRRQQQGWDGRSKWAAPAPQAGQWGAPTQVAAPAERQQQDAAGQVAHLASVLDLSQAAFLPVVQLFEGTGIMLQALHELHCAVLAQRGGGPDAVLPPPLQRAVLRGEAVAGALQLLSQVFDSEHFDDGFADIALEAGLCAEYDAARATLEQLQAAAGQTVDGVRQHLAAAGHNGTVLRRVKLVEFRGEQLLEVPAAVRRDLEAITALSDCSAVLVKEAATIAKYRLPGLAATLEAVDEARYAAKLCVLRFLAESAQLFLDMHSSFKELLNALSTLDVLAGFAAATSPEAAPPGCAFCRPTFTAASIAGSSDGGNASAVATSAPPLRLQGLWHPSLLASRAVGGGSGTIQANNLSLGGPDAAGMLLLTGPNSGGKSTLLRATCVAAVMAQIGCYVPAAFAELAPVDRIFTRIGAQDRICRGESTFAVEMLETSSLLHHSTPSSLVVLDELGRGTATHDGHAIAYGVALHLAQTKRCRSLFATHYHGLTQEPKLAGLVQLGHMEAAVDPQRGLLPSYQLAPGPAPTGSCGVAVAAACQLPHAVVARAAEVAQRAQRACRLVEQSATAGSPGRQPLAVLNAGQQQDLLPAAKRQRLGPATAATATAAIHRSDAALASEQQEALAAVREAALAALAGAPGSAAQLANLQAAVRAALAAGQL